MTNLHAPCPAVRTSDEGPVLSRVVAGMWRMGEWNLAPQARLALIERCIELGITTFDHADIYGNYSVEGLFGAALALQPAVRKRIQLVSKCGIQLVSKARPQHAIKAYDTSAEHITASVHNSLRELQTDYLDLLLLHRPDPLMDFDEVAETFEALREAGKVRHFGVSNFTRHQFECLHRRFPLATNQVEFSPLQLAPLHDETFDGLQDQRVAPMIWSPLGGGRVFRDDPASAPLRTALGKVATETGKPLTTVVFAWIMQLPCAPLPITGSGRIEAIAEAAAATQLKLTRTQWFEILRAATGHDVP